MLIFDHPSFIIAYKSAEVNFHSEEEAGFVVQVSERNKFSLLDSINK